ncbi:MAG: gliding motility-associated C-terminal domain-containing protein [Flavobacterium sp.]
MQKITLPKNVLLFVSVLALLFSPMASAQFYVHNFGTTPINTHPYTGAPSTLDANLSGSSWTNSAGSWSSAPGSSGTALSLANSSGAASITLTFNVSAGHSLDVNSFSFWSEAGAAGAQNWSLSINGIVAGNGTFPAAGANTGTITVANPIAGLTGAVTVVMSLSGASGNGPVNIDDFTLNGTVNTTCTVPPISQIEPLSGPPNTIVTISGSGFLAGSGTSNVKFNGFDAAGFTVLSDTSIKAVVPDDATNGPVTVTTDGCTATGGNFSVIISNCPAIPGTEIFISELYDQRLGTGGMIELYNPTNATINLTGYTLQRYGDIADTTPTSGYSVALTGTIGPESTFLFSANTPNNAYCNSPVATMGFTNGFNASDKIELLKNGNSIDVAHTPAQVGFTMIRKPEVAGPSALFDPTEYNVTLHDENVPTPDNYCNNLGNHTSTGTARTFSAQPLAESICEGEDASFTAAVNLPSGFAYQWKVLNTSGNWVNVVNGDNYNGATTATLNIVDAPLGFLTNQYYCEATTSGCTLVSNAVQLTVSPLPVVVVDVTDATCLFPTGSISITPSVGTDLQYSLNGTDFQEETTFNNLLPGPYTLTIMSASMCISMVPFTIDTPLDLPAVATVSVTQPTCTVTTGTITVTAPLDLGLSFSINGTDYQGTPVFSGLAPGTYQVRVQTLLGCVSVTANIIINPVTPTPAVATTTVTPPTCTTATGSIEITAPTGTGVTYSIDGTTYQDSPVFAGLAPGSYTVYVIDNGSCPSSTTSPVVISPVTATPVAATFSVSQPVCTVANVVPTGTITITAPLGSNYTYSINGTDYQANPVFNAVAVGSYTIYVIDNGSCPSQTATQATIVAPPVAPAPSTFAVTQASCTTPTGSITVTAPLGGTIMYSIDGTSWQASPSFASVAPGTYTVYAREGSNGCPSSSATQAVIDPVTATPAVATYTTAQPTCATPTGSITISGPLGANVTYSIDGTTYQASTTFAGLAPGSYTISVIDGNSCASVTPAQAVINPVTPTPAQPVASVTQQPTCNVGPGVPSGTITVTSPAGTNITYSVDGVTYQSNPQFAGLTPGNYTVYVVDNGSCPSQSATQLTINPVPTSAPVATYTFTQPDCATGVGTVTVSAPTGTNYTYSINGTTFQSSPLFTSVAPGTYSITVNDANGNCPSTTGTFTLNPTSGSIGAITFNAVDPTCTTGGSITITGPTGADITYSLNGGTAQSGTTFSNLADGNYTITAQNSTGCTTTSSTITLLPAPAGPAAPLLSAVQPTCQTGSGSITVTNPEAGATYSIDGTNFQASPLFANLDPGTYTITAQNASGCTTDSSSITLTTSGDTQPQITGVQGCRDLASGRDYVLEGTPINNSFNPNTATYAWKDAAGNTVSTDAMFNVTDYLNGMGNAVFPMQFNLTVTTPGGCSATIPFTIDGTLCGIPKGISPNNDGKNDTFNLIGMTVTKVSIFNRYGHEVYERNNYTNEWFGQGDNGDELPSGTYYYAIETPSKTHTGWVYVNREEN